MNREAKTDLTARDLRVLSDLWLFRYLTTAQIKRLHFPTLKPAQRRLRRLTELELVKPFRTDDAVRAGFRSWCYRLSRAGAAIVADNIGEPLGAVLPASRVPKTMRFMKHHELMTDFRIWLREGCASTDGQIGYRFVPSYEEVREGRRRRRQVALEVPEFGVQIIPDGVMVLDGANDQHALFVVEIDRGTEPFTGVHQSAIERKLTHYRSAFEARSDASYQALFGNKFLCFRVLCLVPDQRRADGFLDLATKLNLVPLVWVTVSGLVANRGDLYTACWQTEPAGELRSLTE